MRRVAPILIGLGLVALGGCGGDGPAIDAKGAELLQLEVAAARSATARGDGAEAAALLQTVDNTVNALRKQDKITSARADEVHAAVDEVRAALLRSAPAPTTTVAPVTNPPVTVAPATAPPGPAAHPEKEDDNENDKHGKRREKREGDD